MAVSRKLITSLKRDLESHADPAYGRRMQSYTKSSLPLYGVRTPVLRRLATGRFRQHPFRGFGDWRDTVLALWRGARYREEKACAVFMCESTVYRQYQALEALPVYEEMIVTGAWWDLVDPVATHCIRHLLTNHPGKISRVLIKWSRDDDIWKRRAAILTQVRLKNKTDKELLFKCIQPSIGSGEFFLQKAIGWALRDYATNDFSSVEKFVDLHRHRLSKLSLREALKNRDKYRR